MQAIYEESSTSLTESVARSAYTPKQFKLLIAALISLAMSQMTILNIPAFYPTFAVHEYQVSELVIGIFISVFSLTYMISAPIIGALLTTIGRKFSIIIGFICILGATTGFACLTYVKTKFVFILLSFLFRIIQGVGDSLVLTPIYSLITLEFADDAELYMGYSQSALALGLVAGPIAGSFLYDYGGYGFVMFSLAIMMVFATIFAAIMIESDQDLAGDEDELLQKFLKEPLLTDKEEVIAVSDEEEEDELPLSYSDIIYIKRVFLTLLCGSVCCIFFDYDEAILALRLEDYNLSELYIGYFFSIQATVFAISSPLVSYISNYHSKRVLLLVALLGTAVSMELMGPSVLLNIPQSTWLLAFGYAVHGLFMGFIYVPLLPELIEAIEDATGQKDERINDMASGLFHASCSLGSTIGPVIGAVLFQHTGFRWTCEILSFVSLFFGIVYFVGTFVLVEKHISKVTDSLKVPSPEQKWPSKNIEQEKKSSINMLPEFGIVNFDVRRNRSELNDSFQPRERLMSNKYLEMTP